jgi:predicted porin
LKRDIPPNGPIEPLCRSPRKGPNSSEAIVIPVFWRYLRMPCRIVVSTLLVFLAAILIFTPAPAARAQAQLALSGVITDPSGAAPANASVTPTNNGTSAAAEKKTGADGASRVSLLIPGDDAVQWTGFASAGFSPLAINAAGTGGPEQGQGRETTPPAATNPDALTWHGVTLYGAYDVGLGWVSHGLPQSPYNYEGSSLVNRNANHSRWLVEPNNLQQTGLGIRGREEFSPGWFVVFNASTGINPQSGQLGNASRTDIDDNGLPRSDYSQAIDGARAGQPLNDEYYGGVEYRHFGTLTFGRQRSLGTDTMIQYDPVAGGYAFSYIGYNGTMAGGGDTEDTRWDDALKYRLTYGPVHFGAMYKFVDGIGGCYTASSTWSATTCTPEQPHNDAYGFNLGGNYHKLSGDIVYQHYNQAISVLNPLLGPQSPTQSYQSTTDSINTNTITLPNLIDTTNTLYGIVTDNNAVMFAAKYTWDHFKYFAGYEYIWQNNPARPLGVGASDQGGYLMSGVEDNNLDSEKIVQIWWTGLKYAYDSRTDITFSWYGQLQNDFRYPKTCTAASYRSSCAGSLDEGSLYVDHHFTKRFDGFAGAAYSFVTGGLAIAIPHGPGVPYLHNSNFAPTIGGRFAF